MRYTVDRIEGCIAIVISEDDAVIKIPLCELPLGLREGSILTEGEDAKLFIDYPAEEEERNRLKRLKERLLKPRV